jgi:hypothetical protein
MSLNQKISGIFPQDSIVPKNFRLSKNNAKYNNIVERRIFSVHVGVLVKPMKIIVKQHNILGVQFYDYGMMTTIEDHNRLMNLLVKSVKYN